MADRRSELEGIGGWLLFFLLTLAVFRPATALWRVISLIELNPLLPSVLGPNWLLVRITEWTIILIDIGICLFLAIRLWTVRRWSSVRLTIAGIWGSILLVTLAEPIAVALITDVSLSQVLGGAAIGAAQASLYCVLWTAYLLKSERVANTYRRYGDRDELETVFS